MMPVRHCEIDGIRLRVSHALAFLGLLCDTPTQVAETGLPSVKEFGGKRASRLLFPAETVSISPLRCTHAKY